MSYYLRISNWDEHQQAINLSVVVACGWSAEGHVHKDKKYPVIFRIRTFKSSSWMCEDSCSDIPYNTWKIEAISLQTLLSNYPERLI